MSDQLNEEDLDDVTGSEFEEVDGFEPDDDAEPFDPRGEDDLSTGEEEEGKA